MHCPFCHNPDSRVVDTRLVDDGASIRRRRECTRCGRRFTTLETSTFQVIKHSGVVEPFSRDKVVSGVRKACHGRPVSEQDLAVLAQQVEEILRSTGVSIVSSDEVGKAILPFLSDLDQIAYLRFASVYRGFQTLEDFESAISELRSRGEDGGRGEVPAGEAARAGDDPAGPPHGAADPLPGRHARTGAGHPPRVAPVEATPPAAADPAPAPVPARRARPARRRGAAPAVQEPTLLDG